MLSLVKAEIVVETRKYPQVRYEHGAFMELLTRNKVF